ncbi:MAG: CPBP family intramembrane metalloprotease [Dehalococcoidales bacterium]|nr:CPBP family intramembrane metalloprotease [Dehalococcoidales bacterium]
MLRFITEELIGIGQFLRRNFRETVVILSATLFLTLGYYYPIGNEWQNSLLYYGVFPILVILAVLRKNPLDFGLRFSNPRVWGKYVLIICLISAVVLFAASFIPGLQSYYHIGSFKIIPYFLTSCVSLAASEFLYRGFLIFGLSEKFKEGSILLQMVPFTLLHLGKPGIETISCLFTGILFGYVAYRGKSFWPAFLIHLFINVFFVGLVNLRFG